MVCVEKVGVLLRPWLGGALLECCDIAGEICGMLSAFDDMHGDPAVLAQQMDEKLFRTVHELTRGDMRVLLDDGRVMRVRVDDFAVMADELLYLQFQGWIRSAFNCSRLRDFAMRHESLAALHALYVEFSAFQTEDELEFIAQTVKMCHPPFRWRMWLKHDT